MQPYYESGGIKIYHGDCRDVLPQLDKVDLLLTDPPYGIEHKSNGQIFLQATPIQGDENIEIAMEVLEHFSELPQMVFFSPYMPLPIKWRSVLVWSKGEHVGAGGDKATCWKRDFELIGIRNNNALAGKRDSAVMKFRALSPPPSGHFAEKPVDLIQRLIWKVGGQTILDPFMGSGTTLVAAKLEGKQAIGIELEERYCEIAAERLRQGVLAFTG